jgi:hypothetical protein
MVKYSLVLLAAVAVFSGCGEDECCYSGIAPTAVIAEADNRTVVAGVPMAFTGAGSLDSDGSVQGYSWTVDGAEVAQGSGGVQALNHTFATAGNHEVCLIVTDNDDLNSNNKECRTVVVTAAPTNTPPVASFTLPATCDSGGNVAITGAGTDGDGDGISSYAWTGADSATGNPNTVTCPAAGVTKTVCLIVADDSGSTNASSAQVCHDITANTVITPIFGLINVVLTGVDGFNILCSSDGTAENNITIGAGTDIQEVYWVVTYNTAPEAPTTTDWTQTGWNIFDSKAAHFCGKWVGGNSWETGDTIDITATVEDNSDNNTTYEFTIDSSGNVSQTN